MDEARKLTDKRLRKIENQITNIYIDAQNDLNGKWSDFLSEVDKNIVNIKKTLETANLSAEATAELLEQYKKELQKQTFGNQKYKKLVDVTADRLERASEIAINYVNNQLPYVYSVNFNQFKKDIQNDTQIKGISFDLVDESTVKKMIVDNPNLLPFKKVNYNKYVIWNKKIINSQILQGIIQGESIPTIAKRIENVTGTTKDSSIRAARTMTTSAENAGRQDSYNAATEKGIEGIEKEWISQIDDRTRASHVHLNGVRVKYNEDFPNGLQYPADSSGAPEEVYNCRCTMRAILPKYNANSHVTGNTTQTYRQWVKQQEKEKREAKIAKLKKG